MTFETNIAGKQQGEIQPDTMSPHSNGETTIHWFTCGKVATTFLKINKCHCNMKGARMLIWFVGGAPRSGCENRADRSTRRAASLVSGHRRCPRMDARQLVFTCNGKEALLLPTYPRTTWLCMERTRHSMAASRSAGAGGVGARWILFSVDDKDVCT